MRNLTCLLLVGVVSGCTAVDGVDRPSDDGEDGDEYYAGEGSLGEAGWDGFGPTRSPLAFDAACDDGEQITIAAVGDVLLHEALQRQAFGQPDRYVSLWRGVKDLLERADVTYANLEGPTAAGVTSSGTAVTDPGETFDGRVYTTYPMFNYNPALIDDLLATGVDVVSTANNHSLDRRSLGVDRTLDALDERGLRHTGTRRAGSREPWYTFTEARGIRIAWLACTFATNGITDRDDQVLFCYEDEDEVLSLVEALAARDDVDAVIVTPHWGEEYHADPNDDQIDLGHRLIDAGATAVIGSHPHVLEPWERYVTAGGREGFIIYSLGNFVSGQSQLARRSTLLLYLGLTRRADGRVVVNGVRYMPLHMSRVSPGLTLQAIDRVGGLADSRALTVSMFSVWNLIAPSEALVTNPQCDPTWEGPTIPHPHDGWIGGSCEDASTCGGATCLDGLPGGLCSELCQRTCPDRDGRPSTFCVDLGLEGSGACVARCSSSAECREGWVCQPTARYGEPDVVRSVCVPAAP